MRFTAALPRFADELLRGLRDMDCGELADEVAAALLGPCTQDPATGALSIRLLGPEPDPLDADRVGMGFGRSIPMRLQGTVFVELDTFGRLQGLEIFGRDDVLQELAGVLPSRG